LVIAIARIDRMSQQHETEVYCYYAEGNLASKYSLQSSHFYEIDTVERNILDLAARQGLSLYTKDNSAGTLHVSSFALEAEKPVATTSVKKKAQKLQKGDFIFKSAFNFKNRD
jgi:E3 ubiquitin-protein ligase SHPRH